MAYKGITLPTINDKYGNPMGPPKTIKVGNKGQWTITVGQQSLDPAGVTFDPATGAAVAHTITPGSALDLQVQAARGSNQLIGMLLLVASTAVIAIGIGQIRGKKAIN